MEECNIRREFHDHNNHKRVTRREFDRGKVKRERENGLTDSSLILQIIHCLQSIHCQGIVRILETNFSEYCKHDGWPWERNEIKDN